MSTNDHERPRYMISIAAELVGMHPQTLRIYESKGLVRPGRTPGGTRLYSEHDLDRLRLIQRLTTELGLNLAGVSRVIALEDELARMRARLDRLEREMREAIERVHRQYRRDLVLYRESQSPFPARRKRPDGLQQADDQVAGGGRRRAGARAPPRQPRALPRAPAARPARPGPSARAASPIPMRCAPRPRRSSRQRPRTEGMAQQPASLGGALEGLRPRLRRGAQAGGRLRLHRASAARARRGPARRAAGADQAEVRGGAARHLAGPGGHLPGAREVRPRPDRARRERQARPGDRPRRGDPARDPGALAAHEEQPGADRRARRRQDGDRRGARAAHRRRRRARGAEGQARLGARHRLAARRARSTAASSRSA